MSGRPSSLALCLVILGASIARGAERDAPDAAVRARMLAGVRRIVAPGVPGNLCVSGADATVVLAGAVDGAPAAFIAAAPMGQGRVVAVGHPGLLDPTDRKAGDTNRWMAAAIRWVARTDTVTRVACRGVAPSAEGLELGPATFGEVAELTEEHLAGIQVALVWTNTLSASEVEALRRWITRGGGAVLAGLGWSWLNYDRPGGDLTRDHPGNQLLAPIGIVWGDQYVTARSQGLFDVEGSRASDAHLLHQLARIEAAAKDSATSAIPPVCRTFAGALGSVGPTDPIWSRVQELVHRLDSGTLPFPAPSSPLEAARWRERLAVHLQHAIWRHASAEGIPAAPDADAFPGRVPADASSETVTTTVDTSLAGWVSTGLYARPGVPIHVAATGAAPVEGLRVRIGCHTDRLWDVDPWRRWPEISWTAPLKAGGVEVSSPHGGLVYVEVATEAKPARVPVVIQGAVRAPFFELGRTTTTEWAAQRAARRAPWSELASRTLVLSVPTSAIQTLTDPGPVLELWDRIRGAQCELAGRPPGRPERFVADEQISTGYLHSGYPVMSHLDVVGLSLDVASLARAGSWGHFHELGHNLQEQAWTFDGAGEVTCNLFTLYAMDEVIGIRPVQHPMLVECAAKARAHIARGAPFAVWKEEPFLALWMYVQVQDAFGWEPFRRVFAEYRKLPESARPSTDDQRRDQWMIRLSRAVGHDLGPFFRRWGVPVSREALGAVRGLPAWLPPSEPTGR